MTITNISSEKLQQMLEENPDLQLVDVRTPDEFYKIGHISNSVLIPIYELPYAFRTLELTDEVVVVCQHGGRSLDACYFLEAQGFDKIYNLEEGLSSWTAPMERGIPSYETLI